MLATSSKQLTKDTTFKEAFDAIDFKTPKIRQLYTEDGKPAGYGQVLIGNKWGNAKVLPKDKAGNYKLWTLDAKDKLRSSELFYDTFDQPEWAGCDNERAWLGGTFENVDILGESYNVQGYAISSIWNPIPQYFVSFERLVCENQFGSLGTTNSSITINLSALANRYHLAPNEALRKYINESIEMRIAMQEKYLGKLRGIKVEESKIDDMFRQLTVDKVKNKESEKYKSAEFNLERYRKAYNRDDNQNYRGTFLGFVNSHTNVTTRTRKNPWDVIQPPVSKSVLENPCTFDYLCRDTLVRADKLSAA